MKTQLSTSEAMARLGGEHRITYHAFQGVPALGVVGAWLPSRRVWVRAIRVKLREVGNGNTILRLQKNGKPMGGGEIIVSGCSTAIAIPDQNLFDPSQNDDISVVVVELAENAAGLIVQVDCVELFE